MNFLDRFEKRVEGLVGGAFAKAFRSEVKPVELASALRREVDDRAAIVGHDRTVVPNDFTIELSTADFDQIEAWGAEALAEELQTAVADYAVEQNYIFVGPVRVTFTEDVELETGRYFVTSQTVRGTIAPPAQEPTPGHPIVEIRGQRYLLTGEVTVIGRGSESDIIVDDTGISRRHVEIRLTPDGPVVTDLGSTNGTFVEGHRISQARLVNGNTLTIGRTTVMYYDGHTPGPGEG